MKKLVIVLISVLLSMPFMSLRAETIKGNGKIVTKEIDVMDFNIISLSVPAKVNFTQSDQYSCSITIDENLLSFIGFKVVSDELRIKQLPSKDGKPLLSFSIGEKDVTLPNYQYPTLQFTKFEINISAPRLENVKLSGSGQFNFENEFSDYKLNVSVNGSGRIKAENVVKISKFDVNVTGSGSVDFLQMSTNELNVLVSGSGSTTVKGSSFVDMDLTMLGSGNIKIDGDAKTAKTKIAGSGDIYMGNISNSIKYDIAGSGHVYYSGDAETKGFIVGSGTIQKK